MEPIGDALLVLVRAPHLLAIAIAPSWVSPEPLPPSEPTRAALGALLLFAGLTAVAVLLARRRGRLDTACGALIGVALVAALFGAAVTHGDAAPLARAAPFVAVPLWGALATSAGITARGLPSRRSEAIGMAAVALLGAALLGGSAGLLASHDRMWWQALLHDPDHPGARARLIDPWIRDGRDGELLAWVSECEAEACTCRELGVEVHLLARRARDARAVATELVSSCQGRPRFAALHAEALALSGDPHGATEEARRGLGLEPRARDAGRLHYALALALERQGAYQDAESEVQQAIALGAGPDAALLGSALAILARDYDRAEERLGIVLAANAEDPRAHYNQALIADHRKNYNGARQGYLAVLRSDPRHADARYNLAQLTWRAGAKDEARHHAQRFAEAFPEDPRAAALNAQMGRSR